MSQAPQPASGGPRATPDDDSRAAPDDEWLRLDPRTVWASTIVVAALLVIAAVPVAIGLANGGVRAGWILFWTAGGVLVGSGATWISEWIRVRVTRYRIDEHRIERKVQLLGSSHTALATERVRNIELSADLVQRWFGIAGVRLASGEADGARFGLQALDRATAEGLRTRLLKARGESATEPLAVLRWGWLRFAPVSVLTPALGAVAYGVTFQVADWFNAVPAMLSSVRDAVAGIPWPALVGLALLAGLLIGIVSTIVIFIEGWWAYRLERHDDGSLELHRGLLVGRHTSFDGRRIRGVTLHEPPGLRQLGAASLDIIAVGVRSTGEEQSGQQQSPALVPAAPRDVPLRVAAAILGSMSPENLNRHPPSATTRRFTRAALTTVGVGLLASVPSLLWSASWWIPATIAALTAVAAALVAADNARGLGHRANASLVVLRKGSVLRRTDVLNREGLLGWNIRRSPLQRRAGLVTVVATSAGGTGAYRLPDLSARQAVELLPTAGGVWAHLVVRPQDR